MSSEYKGIASPCHEAVTDAKGCRSRTIYHKCSRHSGLVQLEELGDHAGCEGGYKHCSKGELLLPALSIVRVLAIAWDEVRGLRRMDCRAVGSTPDPCPMRTGKRGLPLCLPIPSPWVQVSEKKLLWVPPPARTKRGVDFLCRERVHPPPSRDRPSREKKLSFGHLDPPGASWTFPQRLFLF
eukprot:scaffold544_cov320-Pavlova_lutheri.AAC.76